MSKATKTYLNVGCGPKGSTTPPAPLAGPEWRELRLDVNPAVEPDILASMLDMSPIADASVDAVCSSHNMEHLFPHEVAPALREFLRVLKPGGFALITTPDLEVVAELILAGKLTKTAYVSPCGPISALDMIYGYWPFLIDNPFMAHRTGFTAESMRLTLLGAGFEDVQAHRENFAIMAVGFKPL